MPSINMLRISALEPRRYALSILTVLIATGLTLAVRPLFDGRSPMFFFVIAAIVSATYGGVGPGMATTGLSLVSISLFPDPDIPVLAAAHATVIVFGVLGIGISLIAGRLHAINRVLAESKVHLERANQTLVERTDALSMANEELQRFAYALAHDLSAPLRGISALTTVLIQHNAETLDESSKECAQIIVDKVERANAMIKGLLDYAAAGEKPEQRRVVDCNAVVEQVKQDLDLPIRQCGAEILVERLPMIPATESHLTQVFANLISNAIKYRPSVRQPKIHIWAAEQSEDWTFCVEDNGIGLDMKHADEIFGMFRRLHSEKQYEGNGIGLALCKVIVERHGGRIWVESETGHGSRFFFSLPKTGQSQRIHVVQGETQQTPH